MEVTDKGEKGLQEGKLSALEQRKAEKELYRWVEYSFFARQLPRDWVSFLNLYMNFHGRLGRTELALRSGLLFTGMCCFVLLFMGCLAMFSLFQSAVGAILLLGIWLGIWIVASICGASLVVRRLHDLDKRGWWCLLMAVPPINMAFGIYLVLTKGKVKANRFGSAGGA